jgi:hypothetical protein
VLARPKRFELLTPRFVVLGRSLISLTIVANRVISAHGKSMAYIGNANRNSAAVVSGLYEQLDELRKLYGSGSLEEILAGIIESAIGEPRASHAPKYISSNTRKEIRHVQESQHGSDGHRFVLWPRRYGLRSGACRQLLPQTPHATCGSGVFVGVAYRVDKMVGPWIRMARLQLAPPTECAPPLIAMACPACPRCGQL